MNNDATMFLVTCSAMVLFMTPGLAFFYGGLVRASSVVSMMMMSFGSIAIVTVLWVLYGYAIAFSSSGSGDYIGWDGIFGIDLSNIGLTRLLDETIKSNDGFGLSFSGFQATFAIITVALISGAIADRAKFGAWMVFAAIWVSVVYFPVAGWVFNFHTAANGMVDDGGWLVKDIGLLDFAGGTVVEIASGASALALALVLGKRFGFTKGMHAPHNVPLVLIGAGILWFGWFGFNAGSASAANGSATVAFVSTLSAGVGGLMSWSAFDRIRNGKPTAVGAASGAVSGLVAITPSCGYLSPFWALVLGLLVGVLCAFAVDLKYILGFDDSLDVVGIHLVAGVIGTLFIGLAGEVGGAPVGLFFTGDISQLGKQAIGALAVGIFAFVASWLIAKGIEKTMGFRVSSVDEIAGVDAIMHGETAYSQADPRWSWRG